MQDETPYNSDDDGGQMLHFVSKNQKRANGHFSPTAEKRINQVVQNLKMSPLYNSHLDPGHKAMRIALPVGIVHNVEFRHYFIKNKYKNEKVKVFDEMINLLNERGYNEISTISDREEEQIMVVRVVSKVEGSLNTFVIQDQTSKDKLTIKEGLMWVGMICAIKAKWIEGGYKLEKIIDLAQPVSNTIARLSANMQANRIFFVKGPMRPKFGNEDQGIRLISKQIEKLRRKNIVINQIVVMGPILSKTNKSVSEFTLPRTFQEQYEYILGKLRREINNISQEIQIFVQPGLEDIVSIYPIPQPAYEPDDKRNKIEYLSNPSSIKLEGRRSQCKIDLINYDILKYIDTHKAGKATKDLRLQNIETYLKQPFFMTNTTISQQPFDETNLPNLYNHGNFGDLVVFSSNRSPPFINEVNGRIVLNIGSLGIEPNQATKNFMVIASIYEGEGSVTQRIKIETISSQ